LPDPTPAQLDPRQEPGEALLERPAIDARERASARGDRPAQDLGVVGEALERLLGETSGRSGVAAAGVGDEPPGARATDRPQVRERTIAGGHVAQAAIEEPFGHALEGALPAQAPGALVADRPARTS